MYQGSSHIWTGRLGAKARVAMDLLAVCPPPDGKPKITKEYDPPVFPLRWMKYGGLLFLSGLTDMTRPTFDEQFTEIIHRINVTLRDAGALWQDVQRVSFLLHHAESLAVLRERFGAAIKTPIPSMDYSFVGTRQGKRLEVEITATLTS